jgi:hypothetical protein
MSGEYRFSGLAKITAQQLQRLRQEEAQAARGQAASAVSAAATSRPASVATGARAGRARGVVQRMFACLACGSVETRDAPASEEEPSRETSDSMHAGLLVVLPDDSAAPLPMQGEPAQA